MNQRRMYACPRIWREPPARTELLYSQPNKPDDTGIEDLPVLVIDESEAREVWVVEYVGGGSIKNNALCYLAASEDEARNEMIYRAGNYGFPEDHYRIRPARLIFNDGGEV